MSLIGVHEVRELLRPLAPTISVYLGPRAVAADDGERGLILRQRAACRKLVRLGADRASIDAVAAFLTELPDPACHAVFARGGEIVFQHRVPGAVASDLTAFGALPRATPMLSWLQARPAHVRALVGHHGADLVAVPAGATDGPHHCVDGLNDDVRPRFPGGGQLPRSQRRAEDSLLHNAQAIADAIADRLDLMHARLLVLSGDDRAINLVCEQLRRAGRTPRIVILPETRHNEGAGGEAAMERHAKAQAAEPVAEILDGLGRHGRAVAGIEETLTALDRGRIRTLVMTDDHDDPRTAWVGADLLCSAHRRASGAPQGWMREGRLIDIAVRAGLLTRADVYLLSPHQGAQLPDGIGGLLRGW